MAKLETLGKVIETDMLIIGGGIAGLAAAISAKEAHPNLKITIVERTTAGWAGLGTKSGHGFFEMAPGENDPEKFVEFMTEFFGEYLTDQDFLRQSALSIHSTVEKAKEWGVKFATNEDGSIQHMPHPSGVCSVVAIPLNINRTLYERAAEIGVKFINRTYVTDFLKDGEKISGVLAFNVDTMFCNIIKAKSFVVATQACQFGVQLMFNGTGNGIAMSYRAGAEMRNAEFGCADDLCFKNDGHPIYGGCESVFNGKGENISQIYAPGRPEVSLELMIGAEKEMEEGRGPIYVDFNYLTQSMKAIGAQENADDEPGCVGGVRRTWPATMEWYGHIEEKAEKYRVIRDEDPSRPLCTFKLSPESSPIRVDQNYKTSLPNVWAAGFTVYQGASTYEWIRGNGLSMCMKGGMRASIGASEYAFATVHGNIDSDEVAQLKAQFLAPLGHKGGIEPDVFAERLVNLVVDPKYMVYRTDASLKEALVKIAEMKADLAKLYAEDMHTLAKCRDLTDTLLCAEMMFTAGLMRTDTRCHWWRHYRDDFPKQDNKNWLKWIIVAQRDGEMKLWTEDIPIEKYKYRPKDYVPKEM